MPSVSTQKIQRSRPKLNIVTKTGVSMRDEIKKCCPTGCQIDPITKNLPGFKCIKVLGEGGFGTTFLMQKEQEKIALKVVDIGPGRSDIQDIENELNMLKKLSSKCAKTRVLCYNMKFDYGNSSFIVTEFIDGSSLDKYNFKKPKDFYRIFGQLIDAIEYIHSERIIHFDIKPENIMVTNEGDLKIIDFGGASFADKNGFVKMDTYTPEYALFHPSREGPVTLKRGKEYDWHSAIVTIMDIILQNKDTPKDLQPFGEYKKDYIKKLKLVIDSHIDSKSKNFILPRFKTNVRSILKKNVHSIKKKTNSSKEK